MSVRKEDKRKKEIDKKSEILETEDDHISQMQQGASKILVAVRARPLTKKESAINDKPLVHVLEDKVVILLDPSEDLSVPEEIFRQNRSREKQYAFDYSFSKDCNQDMVYEKTTKFLIEGVLNGFNATVFAYGATGAGKTYTMIGEFDSPGLMLKTFLEVFSRIEALSGQRDYIVKLSYLEIYNEIVRDLLNPSMETLEIREDPAKGVIVAGLNEILATSPEHVISSIRNGNRRRTSEYTEANETSSRSHAVLQIVVEHKDKASGVNAEILVGKLSLIDLAGSERASNTKNRGIRLIEGANINRSLLALGNCINALCEASEKGGKVYIPYRDSKLTRLLKDSLGGNCRTVMIACISPFVGAFEDTHNTLTYANRAKNIKTTVHRNVVNVQFHIAKYTSIINQLRNEVSELRAQLISKKAEPSMNIEKFLIELSTHFQEEAETRKNIFQSEQNISQISFTMFARQFELEKVVAEKGEKSAQAIKIYDEINLLKNTIESHERQITINSGFLEDLEQRRPKFEEIWNRQGITEPYLSQLHLELKKNIMNMNSLEIQRKENKAQLVIKKKDMYIKILEEQLKLRDNIIGNTQQFFQDKSIPPPTAISKALKELKTWDELNAHSIPDENLSKSFKGSPKIKSNMMLPQLSNSRIPKPKGSISLSPIGGKSNNKAIKHISPTPTLRKHEDPSPMKMKEISHIRSKSKPKRAAKPNRTNSIGSNSSDLSTISSSNEKKTKQGRLYNNIAEKISLSPYIGFARDGKFRGGLLKLNKL
ncbi:unnamed protein product [Blepharisma stoltei]|uniref:Kinesin-like protein n=1 Tax=Blepharisma stoltei TaxID=1481888 RepID=A0AAU9J6I6_9CILI|nr:unnamed protein product [Blepharisma stoltei]